MANSIRDILGIVPDQVGPPEGVQNAAASSATLRPAENATGAPASDQTALSGLADRIRLAINQANSLSSFRPELVAQLKTAIANQAYSPEPDLVAARVAAVIGRQ